MKIQIFLYALLSGTWLCSCNPSVETEKENQSARPNIILILSDDMGYSDLGCYGGEIKTPTLDNLAGNGLRFSQFYNTARCCPTRASLLTGLYPAQTGVGFMTGDENLPGYRGDLNRNCQTIAEVLKPAGYRTYMAGKWHVTNKLEDVDSLKYNWPLQRGFEKFYGTIIGAGSFWDPWTLTRNNTYISPFADPEYQPENYYYTDAISDNAVKFIQQHREESKEQPFFMYIAYTAAHWPLHAPEEEIEAYRGMYDAGFEATREKRYGKLKTLGLIDQDWLMSPTAGNWDSIANKEWYARNMEVYAAMVTRMDKGIASIIQELEKNQQLENTMIFFLQDNGGCAEEVYWLKKDHGYEKIPEQPVFSPISREALQTEMAPAQTRDGFPVLAQSKAIMAGSDRSYHGYGPFWANVSNTPFRQFKHWVHEGGVATPLIVHWPAGTADPGTIVNQPGHLVDIMATVVEAAGAVYPAEVAGETIQPMAGESLLPLIRESKPFERGPVYFEHEGNRAIREGDWKLVSRADSKAGFFRKTDSLEIGDWELYNLSTDRTEMNNMAAEYPGKVQDLSDKWYQWAYESYTLPKPK